MNDIEVDSKTELHLDVAKSQDAGRKAYAVAHFRGDLKRRDGLLPTFDKQEIEITGNTTADVAANVVHALEGLRRLTADNNKDKVNLPVSPNEIKIHKEAIPTLTHTLNLWKTGTPAFTEPSSTKAFAQSGEVMASRARKVVDLIQVLEGYGRGFRAENSLSTIHGKGDLQDKTAELILLHGLNLDSYFQKKMTELRQMPHTAQAPLIARLGELGYAISPIDPNTNKVTLIEVLPTERAAQIAEQKIISAEREEQEKQQAELAKREAEAKQKAEQEAQQKAEAAARLKAIEDEKIVNLKLPRPENTKAPLHIGVIQHAQIPSMGFKDLGLKASLDIFSNDTMVAKVIQGDHQLIEMRTQLKLLAEAQGAGGLPVLYARIPRPNSGSEIDNIGYVMEKINGTDLSRMGGLELNLSQRLWLIQDWFDVVRKVGVTSGDLSSSDGKINKLDNMILEDGTGRIRFIDWGDDHKSVPLDDTPTQLRLVKKEISALVKFAFGSEPGYGIMSPKYSIEAPKGLDKNLLKNYEDTILRRIEGAQTAQQLMGIDSGM